MKILLKIAKFIFMFIITICIISTLLIKIASLTVLDKNYIMSKLEESGFYTETYNLIETNFENYIYQSGLKIEALDNICSQKKVTDDINKILSNIYDGTNEKIDTTDLTDNLIENIEELGMNGDEEAVEKFVKIISDEYIDSIFHTSYEQKINNLIVKIKSIIDKLIKIIIIVFAVTFTLLVLVSVKDIANIINTSGITIFASGAFILILYIIININVKFYGIKLLNDAFTNSLVTILNDIMSCILKNGIILTIVGLALISTYSIINVNRKNKKKHNK